MRKTELKRTPFVRKPKEIRPKSQKNSARRKDKQVAKVIKASKVDGICKLCGGPGPLQGHHVLTRGAYIEMVDCPENIIAVCVPCHEFVQTNPVAGRIWIEEKYPGLRDSLLAIAFAKRKGVAR